MRIQEQEEAKWSVSYVASGPNQEMKLRGQLEMFSETNGCA